MALTVADVLRLETFKDAKVLAGHEGLHRRVERVDVAEVPDLEGWVRGGELMVTCGYAVKDEIEKQVALVETLARANSAGLVLKVQRYLKKVDPQVLAVADRLRLPLIDLPPWVPFTDVTVPVLSSLLAEKTVLLERILKIHGALTGVVLEGGGMKAIAETLAEAVQGSVTIEDADRRVLAAARADKPVSRTDPIVDESRRIQVPIILDDELCGHVIIEPSVPNDERLYKAAAEHAATVAALELAKRRAVDETEARLQGDLVFDLIHGNFASDDAMIRRARALRWDLTHLEIVMVVNVDACGDACETAGSSEPADETQVRKAHQRLYRKVREVVTGLAPQAITTSLGDRVVILAGFPHQPQEPVEAAKELARRILQEVQLELSGVTVSIGIGNSHRSWTQLAESYREALKALRIGRAMSSSPGVFAFSELGLYRLLFDLSQQGPLADFCSELLDPLICYDARHGTHLLATLEAFLERNGNLAKTASHLFVHRNTLAYRLRRVQELLRVDLSRQDVRLQLLLALKARRVIAGLQPLSSSSS